MSEITFSASLDSSKLEAAIKESNRVVGDWARDVEKAGGKADQAFSKLGTSLKDSIRDQKEYIKGLTKEIKDMQKAFDDATAGTQKRDIGNELLQAKRRLSEATGELIGMQNEQIAINNKEKESTDSLTGSIGKWALSLGGVAMILKTLKDALLQTTTGLNIFNQISAVTKQVLNDIVTGVGINMGNIQNAIAVQKQLNELRLKDKIEVYQAAQYMNMYQKLYVEAIDQTKSVEDRIKIISKALETYNKAIDIQVENTKNQIQAVKQLLLSQPDDEKLKMQYADLMTTMVNLDAQREQGTKRLRSQESGLLKELNDRYEKTIELIRKAAEEQIEIDNSIAEQTKLLEEAVTSGSDAEIKAITKRILALKEEQRVREKIAGQIIDAMQYQGFSPTVVPTSGIKTPSVLPKTKKPTTQKQWDQIQTEMTTLRPANQDIINATKKAQKEINKIDQDDLDEQLKKRNEILAAASELTFEIGRQIGLSEEGQQALGATLSAFEQGITGNWAGAAATLLTGLMQLVPDEMAKFQERIDQINIALQEQQRLIDLSARKGGTEVATKQSIELLKQQKEVQEQALKMAQISLADKQGALFGIGIGVSGAKKKVNELTQAVYDTEVAIEEAEQSLTDFLTGGITENTIADVIAQGFQEGKTSVDDFADYMNQILTDAVMQVFTESLLSSDKMKSYMTWLKTAMEGGITPEEAAQNAKLMADLAAENKAAYEAMTGGLIPTGANASQTGLSGGIQRQITEETGSELAGLFRRFADEQRVVKDYSIMGVNHLVGIEANTAATVTQLQLAIVELQGINKNTKQVPTASL